ncbi:MBL fold metallo-hydrolase [Patulibacter minatonensis]|uniref:MBL fold metallo-hydrolase n=1 Tax=Patulibacter minatonensis TaxID=298163 RepID=UPI0004790DFC|nr:MBL fold metallo-hydrolase [Patulibacter minatonensis]
MRALAVHPDVLVVVSRVWQTTAAIVRAPAGPDAPPAGGDPLGGAAQAAPREAFLVDSPVYPDELELTAQVAGQAGFGVAGLLATHGDWDHLLGRLAFPDAALGVAETTAARLSGHSGEAVRALREFDAEHYVQRGQNGTPPGLKLGELQALPVPGKIGLAGPDDGSGSAPPEHDLELHPAPGHVADGMAIWVPWARTLICGDYLSPVEIPTWHDHDGSRSQYRATLDVLKPLVDQADWVIPGHGGPIDGDRALAIWREDVAYVDRYALPIARSGPRQKQLDAANRTASGG